MRIKGGVEFRAEVMKLNIASTGCLIAIKYGRVYPTIHCNEPPIQLAAGIE
jgi:hypothetical protein